MTGCAKLNFDASFFEDKGEGALGVVLQYKNGGDGMSPPVNTKL
jgi:ribonuclease HI